MNRTPRLDRIEAVLLPRPPQRFVNFARELIRFGGSEPTTAQADRLAAALASPDRDRLFRALGERSGSDVATRALVPPPPSGGAVESAHP